ncbi:MAG: hypothetical protein QOG73_2326 [Acetobacteraceae bacterium]|jgi:hypothetical protein|nr:hypothetical protein [Acetobacteraceae bacterium]MEA2789920.1 hypothetical protein [Acetobacteraceae bacterium]
MPIRREFRALYPPDWAELSRRIRFERAGGRCQRCHRPHLAEIRCLPDGRWFDETTRTWRNRRGRPARWPDLIDVIDVRLTRVVLAAAHLDNNPGNNRDSNLRGFCQRCHMLHDRPFHLAQRRLTYRRRWAIGDLFLGLYIVQTPLPVLFATAYQARISLGRARVGPDVLATRARAVASWLPQRVGGRATARASAEDLFERMSQDRHDRL